jgi:hypothetical protein
MDRVIVWQGKVAARADLNYVFIFFWCSMVHVQHNKVLTMSLIVREDPFGSLFKPYDSIC